MKRSGKELLRRTGTRRIQKEHRAGLPFPCHFLELYGSIGRYELGIRDAVLSCVLPGHLHGILIGFDADDPA